MQRPDLVFVTNDTVRHTDSWGLQGLLKGYRYLLLLPEQMAAAALEPRLVMVEDTPATPIDDAIRTAKSRWPDVSVLGLISGIQSTVQRLSRLFDAGMDDFVFLPAREGELRIRLERQLTVRTDADSFAEWKRSLNLESLIGSSPAFEQALRRIPPLAVTDATVLVCGETGTGKELFARALHYGSRRKSGPFVPVNCGALPENLLENELFGHVRGAFTDAGSSEKGLLAVAEGGTLFLDEADSLSPRAQVKLLRFLQDREYRPLGSTRNLVADVRILAAANQDLGKLVKSGHLREDLYHRLNVLRIVIPPLRQRPGDLPQLAQYFLARFRIQYGKPPLKFSAAAMTALTQYQWPGNIRELEGVVQRAVLLAPEPQIQVVDLDLPGIASDPPAVSSFQEAKEQAIAQFERAYLVELLDRFAGNISHAAEAAGKERRSFQRLLQKRGVTRERAGMSTTRTA